MKMKMKVKVKVKPLLWAMKQRLTRSKRVQVWGGALICWILLTFATPKIPYSPTHHVYADMRNFLGVPNTLNVLTNFPFLIVGVVGLVFCLQGSFFNIGLTGEIVGWALFYAGIAGVAFGSAYYHLRPDDDRVVWDTLPMMVAYASLFSSFLVERVGQRMGLCFLWVLLLISFLSAAYERTFNDLRLRMMFQLIPCIVIPFMTLLFPPKYTHSRYWLWAAAITTWRWLLVMSTLLLTSLVKRTFPGAPVFGNVPYSVYLHAFVQKPKVSKRGNANLLDFLANGLANGSDNRLGDLKENN